MGIIKPGTMLFDQKEVYRQNNDRWKFETSAN